MKQALQKVFSLFKKAGPPRKRSARKTRGQSLVEVAIAFPVLIMLFSGVVEFGFILNYYLSLLDATREAARIWSSSDPFNADGSDNLNFYINTADAARDSLDPSFDNPSYEGRRIALDPLADDVIVSVYGLDGNNTPLTYPDGGHYHLCSNSIVPLTSSTHCPPNNYQSVFTPQDILNARVADAPNAGLLLVEVHYNYHQVLALPWLTPFVPNPTHLVAYTIMPIRAAEPLDTPP